MRRYTLLALVPFLFAGCNTSGLISTQQEVEVGRRAAQQVESENRVLTGTTDATRVARIGQRVAAQRARKDITYNVKLLDRKDVNAVSLPGGWVYAYQGLVDLVDSGSLPGKYPTAVSRDDLLAGVMAHEVAHVEGRHHAKMMGRSALYGIAIGALTKGNVSQWAGFFANINLLQYSRADENDADSRSLELMHKAGYNPYGMVAFLEMLQAKSKSSGGGLQGILATHPPTAERVKRTRDMARELTGR